MAASETLLVPATVLTVDNKTKVGKNLACETHIVTYDSDKTVEVATTLTQILWASYIQKSVTPTITVPESGDSSVIALGIDGVITVNMPSSANTTTIGASVNNAGVWLVTLWGYS